MGKKACDFRNALKGRGFQLTRLRPLFETKRPSAPKNQKTSAIRREQDFSGKETLFRSRRKSCNPSPSRIAIKEEISSHAIFTIENWLK
ncbi:MAG: hypothetical protein V1493_05480 [Candidatus Diapherotrites archaeon]